MSLIIESTKKQLVVVLTCGCFHNSIHQTKSVCMKNYIQNTLINVVKLHFAIFLGVPVDYGQDNCHSPGGEYTSSWTLGTHDPDGQIT